jgi:alpha-1,3-glucan synthase
METSMGDLIGFERYLNESKPFDTAESKVVWKSSRQYHDFAPSNDYNKTCAFPRFWNETGFPVDDYVNKEFQGCYNGDFDQVRYLVFIRGDTEVLFY